MSSCVYEAMQRAVDIVATSPHPTNKIAATLAGRGPAGDFTISRTNYWPPAIENQFGRDRQIGNSSGTIHAETACIIHSPGPTGDSALFLTDLPCPNCVKNIAEAGITSLYIDHKGFDKDFAIRRGHHFENMSMRICEKAGISVYRIFRKEKKTETILQTPEGYIPALEKPPHIENVNEPISPDLFRQWVRKERERYDDHPYAVAFGADDKGKIMMLSAQPHPVIGYTFDTMEEPENKYSFILQPMNRVLMTAARYGVKIQNGSLYSSIVPTARELVNIVGEGLTELQIGDRYAARDQFGPQAMAKLESAGILRFTS